MSDEAALLVTPASSSAALATESGALPAALPAFGGYGIELEYMIVDADTLSAMPVADQLLQRDGHSVTDIERGIMGWSNELVLHLIEVKNMAPLPDLETLPAAFASEIAEINRRLGALGARLMPTAMHPWLDPLVETRLWPHAHAEIYRTYDRIFDARQHGWANLQSMHLNLPFAGDAEFASLHAAARLLLPLLPALAASSPITEGRHTGWLDYRMEAYRQHTTRLPAVAGEVVPDTCVSAAAYRRDVLAPMYRQIAPLDPQGVLRHEWLNAHGLIARFDRNALEIRVIDMQECPAADLALAALALAVVKALYDGRWSSLAEQQALPTAVLVDTLARCLRDADQAVIDDANLLRCLGLTPRRCPAGELWRHLADVVLPEDSPHWRCLAVVLDDGPLARRILRALDHDYRRTRLRAVYGELCECLAEGRMFVASH